MRISAVRATTVDVPLPRPIVMGEIRFESREYLIVEVDTDSGLTGIGFGMTRNSPAAAVVHRSLTPNLLGQDPLLTEATWERLYYRNLPMGQRGIFMRALSAVDIALWDIKGQAAGLPLWQLLGGARERVPVLVAGGYPASDRTIADLRSELADYAARGIRTVKIAGGELADDTVRLKASRRALGDSLGLAYDAHWAWRDLLSVVPVVRGWRDLGMVFIEDPYPSEQVELSIGLREQTGERLALGEDGIGRWAFHQILERQRPDVLRVDATLMGGISEAIKVCALAATLSVPVLPHVFPQIHIHLAAAYPGILAVEMTDRAYETESLHRVFRDWVTLEGGDMLAPTEPGLGAHLDADAVERYTVRAASFH